jgi:hypothetical protein
VIGSLVCVAVLHGNPRGASKISGKAGLKGLQGKAPNDLILQTFTNEKTELDIT